MQTENEAQLQSASGIKLDEVALTQKLLIGLTASIFFLISLGGFVRNIDAGLSCPDWPLCFGKFIPHFDTQVYAEFIHRVVAGLVSILNFGIVILIFRNAELKNRLKNLALLSLGILFWQVILGGLTVLQLLKGEIVTLHLVTGTSYFITLLWMTKRALRMDQPDVAPASVSPIWKWNVVALVVLVCQMVLGGVTSSHRAGLACPDFPKCLGEWWPQYSSIVTIHVVHRLGALITTLVFLGFITAGLVSNTLNAENKNRLRWILFFLICQVLLGIGNVVFRIPVTVGVLHLAIAQTLVALNFINAYEIYHQKLR